MGNRAPGFLSLWNGSSAAMVVPTMAHNFYLVVQRFTVGAAKLFLVGRDAGTRWVVALLHFRHEFSLDGLPSIFECLEARTQNEMRNRGVAFAGRSALQIFANHLFPGGPVMGVVGIPNIEFVGNFLVTQDAIEMLVGAEALVVGPGGEDVGVAPIVLKEPGVG